MSFTLTHKKYKTEELLSDEDKWQRLNTLLHKVYARHGQVFVPSSDFYHQSLVGMATDMLDWIGVNVGTDNLYVQIASGMTHPGDYQQLSKDEHLIRISDKHKGNVLECAAILSHELMHYLLLGGLSYRLENTTDNEQLTDMATVYCGLGIVYLNGFSHEGNNWLVTAILLGGGMLHYSSKSMSFGYYKPRDYGNLIAGYIEDSEIPLDDFAGSVLKASSYYLPSGLRRQVKGYKPKSQFYRDFTGSPLKARFAQVGVALITVIVLVAIRGAFGGSSTPSSDPQTQQLKSAADSAKATASQCQTDLDSLNSQVNQLNSQMATDNNSGDTADYNALIPQQNQAVNQYNAKRTECQSDITAANNAVDAYNQHIGQ
jgi:hypothetical protein